MSQPSVHDPAREPFANPAPKEEPPPALLDLPPVEPPSAGFVVQLFVIPAAVVVVVIVVWLLFGKLAGGERDAMEYVDQLRLPTANWRSAFEMASLIQNDPAIASDPRLLGELTDLLAHELDRAEDPKQKEDPKLAQYVTLTLGAFQTLEARTRRGQAVDPIAALVRALEPKYDSAIRMAAAASLAKQAARLNGRLDDARAVKALGETAANGDPQLRQMAVYALGFFGGPAATQHLRDRVRSDEDRFTRYNAAVALGRRGDPAAEATLREMLATTDLDKVIEIPTPSEKQNKIEAIQLEALEALRTSVRNDSPQLARSLRPELEKLTRSGLVSVRSQALEVLRAVAGGQ
jgi:HEAT repeat protein